VEETADFIKQLVNSQKNEAAREMTRVLNEIEHLRRDIADKSSNTDLLNTKA
jgi:gas vesicle protein